MKFENTRVYNFEHALRGMRNPKESYDKIDSVFGIAGEDWYAVDPKVNKCLSAWDATDEQTKYLLDNSLIHKIDAHVEFAMIGPNDMKLARTLTKAGSVHRKFLRQIFVTVDIAAPLYW